MKMVHWGSIRRLWKVSSEILLLQGLDIDVWKLLYRKKFHIRIESSNKINYDINLKPLTLSRRSKRSEIWKAYMALWQSSRWLRCLHDDIKAFKGLPMKISDKWDHHAITSFIYIAPVLFSLRITTPAYEEDDCATNIYDIASHKPFSSRQQKLQRQGRRVWMF